MVANAAPQPNSLVIGLSRCARGDVVGALHDHRQQLERGFLALLIRILSADDLGHPDVSRVAGFFLRPVPVVCSLFSHPVDVRNAGDASGSARTGGGPMTSGAVWGLMV